MIVRTIIYFSVLAGLLLGRLASITAQAFDHQKIYDFTLHDRVIILGDSTTNEGSWPTGHVRPFINSTEPLPAQLIEARKGMKE